jgi:hypothetical protein
MARIVVVGSEHDDRFGIGMLLARGTAPSPATSLAERLASLEEQRLG